MARSRPDAVTARRLARLRDELGARDVGALLVTHPVDVGYLSGFTGEDSWLVAGRRRSALVTDSRFAEQAGKECRDAWVSVRRGSLVEELARVVRRLRLAALGFDPDHVSVSLRGKLGRALKGVRLVPVAGAVAGLRTCKDSREVRAIERAVAVAEEAWRAVRRRLRPGRTERQMAADLDHEMRRAGAEGPAFPTILAVDASASMPHARPGGRRLKPGSLLLADFGAQVGGYVCDLTRVVVAGRMQPHIRRAYASVLEAQSAAIARLAPGTALRDVDAAARGVLEAAGLGRHFRHGTGHGLGRQVHEAPNLGPQAPDGVLEAGMVVTVEPGVYFPGRFGIRIEDDVLVTAKGGRVLTHLEKDPEAIVL